MAEDDDDYWSVGLYENGHWDWEESTKEITFLCDAELIEEVQLTAKVATGTIEFKDNVDLIEQIRFRKRYQRKVQPGEENVITIQDVKDIAIYTAPLSILTPMLISTLHSPTTERFIRALIFCVQYYLQIADEMTNRTIAFETKIRTPQCEVVERDYSENLSDLRLLVAKEYSTVLFGASDMKNIHHMGPNKKRRSLSVKDARFMESFLRMCVQIVWLALGRKSFNQIELEINRMFKTDIFNLVEHKLRTNYITRMTKEEREVLLGHCVRHDKKLDTRSPLINEVSCHREIDYRAMGLGVIKYTQYDPRLGYLKNVIAAPEETLVKENVVLGIIGLPRSNFDTMLNPLQLEQLKSKMSMSSTSKTSRQSDISSRKSISRRKLYPDIILPGKESQLYYPSSFSEDSEKITPRSKVQLRRWQNRLHHMLKSRNH